MVAMFESIGTRVRSKSYPPALGNQSGAADGTGKVLSAYAREKRRRLRIRRFMRGACGIAFVLIVWHLMSAAYGLEQILPTPLDVAATVVNTLFLNHDGRWLYGPNIYEHLASSFLRALIGFMLAAVVAIPMGIVVGRFTVVREFFDPIVRSLYPIPGIAWIPLAILWFGLGNVAVVAVVFMAEFLSLIHI